MDVFNFFMSSNSALKDAVNSGVSLTKPIVDAVDVLKAQTHYLRDALLAAQTIGLSFVSDAAPEVGIVFPFLAKKAGHALLQGIPTYINVLWPTKTDDWTPIQEDALAEAISDPETGVQALLVQNINASL